MNGISKSIMVWGLICLVGFGVYPFASAIPGFPHPLVLWSVLTLLGCASMVLMVPFPWKNKVVLTWLVLTVGGMILHAANSIPQISTIFFNGLAWWALLMSAGFFLTGKFWKSHYWYGVSALNVVAFALLAFAPEMVGDLQSPLLALTSGIPMMYAGLKG